MARDKMIIFVVTVIIFVGFSIYCTTDNIAGNGTLTGNPTVTGYLYTVDGKTPARNAVVTIRSRTILADTSGSGLGKRFADTSTVTTDGSGKFEFDSTLDTGLYVIEANQGDTGFAIIDSVQVTGDDSTVEVADTLKPAGSITGTIYLAEGGDVRKVFILAFGINRFAAPDTNGVFTFDTLAEGRYDLRIISSLDNYDVLDTFGVPVVSEEEIDLDTLRLRFTGIPTVKGLSLGYDTLKQIVTLTWNAADTGLVQGYNVYRRHVDSGLVKINTAVVTDTLFRDSTALQNNSYIYQVKAVDKDGNEGLLSGNAEVEIVSAYSLSRIIDIKHLSTSLVKAMGIPHSENIIVLSRAPAGVYVFDSSVTLIDSFGIGILEDPYDFTIDTSVNVYITDIQKRMIFKFDSTGSLIGEWNTNFGGKVITLGDSAIFVGTPDDVEIFSFNGDLIGGFSYSESNLKGIAVGSDNDLFIYGSKTITKYSRDGIAIDSIYNTDLNKLTSYNDNGYLVGAQPDRLLFVLNNELYIITESGELILKIRDIGIPFRFHLQNDNTIWLTDFTGIIRIYRR